MQLVLTVSHTRQSNWFTCSCNSAHLGFSGCVCAAVPLDSHSCSRSKCNKARSTNGKASDKADVDGARLEIGRHRNGTTTAVDDHAVVHVERQLLPAAVDQVVRESRRAVDSTTAAIAA